MAESSATEAGSKRQIVILGGSYGGVSAAHNILMYAIPQLPDKDRVPCQRNLFVGIANVFEPYPDGSFHLIHGSATDLDTTNRSVSVRLAAGDGSFQKLDFYALVIATGASTPSPLLGLNEHSSDALRKSYAAFREALPTARTIIVTGGDPTGVETAAELGNFLNGRAGFFASTLANPKVAISLVTATLPPPVHCKKRAEGFLAKLGVTVIRNARVEAVEPQGAGSSDITAKTIVTLEDGTTREADLYSPATGVTPDTGFISKELLAEDGRVNTNASTLRVDKVGPRVYAIGDVASYSRPAIYNILSVIPVFSANIKRHLLLGVTKEEGEEDAAAVADLVVGDDCAFKEDTCETQLVPIRRTKGVGSAMGYQIPSFLVWLIKGQDYWLWTTGNLWSGKQWAKES